MNRKAHQRRHRSDDGRVMDCGGKRSATPLSDAPARSKASSPLRSAAALHDAAEKSRSRDETEYLLSDPARRKRLLEAVEDIRVGRNLITPDQSLFTRSGTFTRRA
jgi:hypothetical protein